LINYDTVEIPPNTSKECLKPLMLYLWSCHIHNHRVNLVFRDEEEAWN
jgi:hypothetical protein